jgi:hypothetical protein
MATASHATVDRQQLGKRLKGAGCRSRQERRHPRPVSMPPSGTSTSRPSHRSLLFNAHHPFFVMPEHQLRDLGEPPFQAPISPSKCSMICVCPPRVRCFARMSAAHVSSSFLHRPLSGLRAAVFLQGPVSVPPPCTPARVGKLQAITSPEPVPPRSASHHRSRRRCDRAADVEPARAVNLWLSLRAVMFSPCRCAHSHTKPQRIPDPGTQMSLEEFRVQTWTFSRKTSWASAH